MKTRLLGPALALVCVGMLAAPIASYAAEADADTFAFETAPSAAVMCWVLNTCNSTQDYMFTTGGLTCEYVSADGPSETVPDAEVNGCGVTSSGFFNNIVCGTAVFTGAPTTLFEQGSDQYTMNGYTIAMVGGIGVLVAPSVTESGNDDVPAPGAAAGVVQFGTVTLSQPQANPNNPGICTTAFALIVAIVTNA